MDTGAGTSDIVLPSAAGKSVVNINTGASTLLLHIPENVAAKIWLKTGMTSVNVNTSRFPMIGKNRYESTDFLTATNGIEITISAGVGTIKID